MKFGVVFHTPVTLRITRLKLELQAKNYVCMSMSLLSEHLKLEVEELREENLKSTFMLLKRSSGKLQDKVMLLQYLKILPVFLRMGQIMKGHSRSRGRNKIVFLHHYKH